MFSKGYRPIPCAPRLNFQDSVVVDVDHNRNVVLSFAKTFFINANVIYLFELPQLQASLDCAVHDGMYRLPVQPKQGCCSRHVGACLNHFNCHAFEQKRKPRMFVGPRSGYRQDSASFALRASAQSKDSSQILSSPGLAHCDEPKNRITRSLDGERSSCCAHLTNGMILWRERVVVRSS